MSGALRLTAAGPFSTLQDAGRFGFQRFGVSTAGAFDTVYFQVANLLAGNPPGTAAIEVTLLGDSYTVTAESCRVAFAGDFALSIDETPAATWRSHRLSRGQRLRIGAGKTDVRGYLAVAGGFAVTPMLGSVATHSRTGLGGLDGGALKAGDELPLALSQAPERAELALDARQLPKRQLPLRVVPGPQGEYFSQAGWDAFLGSDYLVSREADRMGYRLSGPRIEHALGYNIISDGIPLGAIQVPGEGQPIVLLVDRQTTGGYPKIATMIGPDVAALAQVKSGDALRFAAVTFDAARAIQAEHRRQMAALAGRLVPVGDVVAPDNHRLLSENLIGGVVDVTAEEWRLL